jgi:hypothetical protein
MTDMQGNVQAELIENRNRSWHFAKSRSLTALGTTNCDLSTSCEAALPIRVRLKYMVSFGSGSKMRSFYALLYRIHSVFKNTGVEKLLRRWPRAERGIEQGWNNLSARADGEVTGRR